MCGRESPRGRERLGKREGGREREIYRDSDSESESEDLSVDSELQEYDALAISVIYKIIKLRCKDSNDGRTRDKLYRFECRPGKQ